MDIKLIKELCSLTHLVFIFSGIKSDFDLDLHDVSMLYCAFFGGSCLCFPVMCITF